MQSTSQEENFQEKLFLFWELLQPLENFLDSEQYLFWFLFENLQSVCGNCISRVQKKFRESLGKIFDCFVVFGSRRKISVFFWILHKPFRQRCQTTFSSPEETFRVNFFFWRSYILFSIFKPWTEIFGSVSKINRMVVRFQLYMFGGSFG